MIPPLTTASGRCAVWAWLAATCPAIDVICTVMLPFPCHGLVRK